MERIRKSWLTFLTYSAKIGTLILIVNMVACSGSSRTPVGGNFDTNTADNQDLFSDPTNTGTTNSPTFDQSLFDTQLGTDPNGSGVDSLSNPTASEQECLAYDDSLWDIGTGSGSANPTCYQSMPANYNGNQQMQPFFNAFQQNQLPEFMMNSSVASFGLMDQCVQMAAMLPQVMGAQQGADWHQIFRTAKVGLVRCFRAINRWQSQSMPWAMPQQTAFGYNDNNLWNMMVIFEDHD